jgi:hypothetical protein
MGSGFKSRGVHHRNPVFMATSLKAGFRFACKSPQGHLHAIYFTQRCAEIQLPSAANLHPAVPQLPDRTV